MTSFWRRLMIQLPTLLRRFYSSLFQKTAMPHANRGNRVRPWMEALEERVVPALAHSAPMTLQGTPGIVTLANNGGLAFKAGAVTTSLDKIASAFNVDTGGNLFELNSNANLWELP